MKIGIGFSISATCHLLKHPIDHANMEVHMLVQAGAKAVYESHGADVQRDFLHIRRSEQAF